MIQSNHSTTNSTSSPIAHTAGSAVSQHSKIKTNPFRWINTTPKNFDKETASLPKINRRRRTNAEELKILETSFIKNPTPNACTRQSLADTLKITAHSVQV